MSSFIDNLKFYVKFTYTLVTSLPKTALVFLFYTIFHQLLGVDPAPKRAVANAFKRDLKKPCPYARALGSHEYIAPAPGTRSPCPALNVMANHGYLYVFTILLRYDLQCSPDPIFYQDLAMARTFPALI